MSKCEVKPPATVIRSLEGQDVHKRVRDELIERFDRTGSGVSVDMEDLLVVCSSGLIGF